MMIVIFPCDLSSFFLSIKFREIDPDSRLALLSFCVTKNHVRFAFLHNSFLISKIYNGFKKKFLKRLITCWQRSRQGKWNNNEHGWLLLNLDSHNALSHNNIIIVSVVVLFFFRRMVILFLLVLTLQLIIKLMEGGRDC